MAKIIKFGKKPEGEDKENKGQTSKVLKAKEDNLKNAKPLTQEEFQSLFEPLKEGLKRLYPSQVEEVLGFSGLGERNGEKVFVVGVLMWKRYGVKDPLLSTMVAIFNKGKLEKVSFLEAKKNYWDWKTLLKVHKKEFHTEEIFNRFMELVGGSYRV